MEVKRSKTHTEYKVKAFGYDLTIPAGSIVTNQTACGPDDSYHFWVDWKEQAEHLTGYKNSTLAFDLTHYGINIPAEYCEAYE